MRALDVRVVCPRGVFERQLATRSVGGLLHQLLHLGEWRRRRRRPLGQSPPRLHHLVVLTKRCLLVRAHLINVRAQQREARRPPHLPRRVHVLLGLRARALKEVKVGLGHGGHAHGRRQLARVAELLGHLGRHLREALERGDAVEHAARRLLVGGVKPQLRLAHHRLGRAVAQAYPLVAHVAMRCA